MIVATQPVKATTAATAFLEALKRRGVDYLFGNAGTDFAAIIEAYATHPQPSALPRPITVPHENLAVAMAHGAYLATGNPQAVMVHVNVGTANAICGLINASREQVPLILCAGRNPITETGSLASRNAFIHWAQEMFDQGAMVREVVKWDYELRRADQTDLVVDRAISIATAHPRGPVYLTLPRETFGEPVSVEPARTSPQVAPPAPDENAINIAAKWLAEARRPLIVTGALGREARERQALAAFAGAHSIAVAAHRPRFMPLDIDNASFVGFEPGPLVEEADLIIVASCDVPWIPLHHSPGARTRVIHLAFDPNFSRYPVRGFQADLAIDGDVATAMRLIQAASHAEADVVEERIAWLDTKRTAFRTLRERAVADVELPSYAQVARCLADVSGEGDTILAETAFPTELLALDGGGGYFGAPSSGGLGWALGAALGIKLTAPERRVISLVGDGAYMFGNPTPAHFVSRANQLPTLTIIMNNSMWAAVRRATLSVYPDSETRLNRNAVFTYLEPSPEYEKIVEASGGYGERVEQAKDLPAALRRALYAVEQEGRQAVLNVLVA